MRRRSLFFTGPRAVMLREEPMDAPAPDEVAVRTRCSAISAGTEMLIYRGQAPAEMSADASIEALDGGLTFPLKYGYSVVGEVYATGAEVSDEWKGRRVFAFHPHESDFTTRPEALLPLPDHLSDETAVFLPNAETAVNFVMDGRPMIGETVCVFGQGVVGLLTTALLARFPLEQLVALDRHEQRRSKARAFGAGRALSPEERRTGLQEQREGHGDGVDLCYELTGKPAVLNDAIDAAGYHGRIVVGSWYGAKKAPIDLGGRFHRERLRIVSSQVSTIAPSFRGRWTKERRLQTALDVLAEVPVDRLITHRFAFDEAEEAFAQLDRHPDQTLQVVLTYGAGN